MKANVGDWLVIKASTIDEPDERGLITEVHSPDGAPPYLVRWLSTGHAATVFPGADAVVITAAELAEAHEREQRRFGAVQSVISHAKNESAPSGSAFARDRRPGSHGNSSAKPN